MVCTYKLVVILQNTHTKGASGYTLPSSAARISIQARNRWFVAYTLIKNPKLRKTRQIDYPGDIVPPHYIPTDVPDEAVVPEKVEFSSQYIKC